VNFLTVLKVMNKYRVARYYGPRGVLLCCHVVGLQKLVNICCACAREQESEQLKAKSSHLEVAAAAPTAMLRMEDLVTP